jgi:hypothetical protein
LAKGSLLASTMLAKIVYAGVGSPIVGISFAAEAAKD